MSQLAIGDNTKHELRKLADEHTANTPFDKLSFDQFLRIMMDYWKEGHSA